jgi:hypothetical protein
MSINNWGPATWTLFHTLAAKINENDYNTIGIDLFMMIKNICGYLPCPECSEHAKKSLDAINLDKLKTKEDLINVLHIFHNSVNKRKQKPLYSFSEMDKYKNMNLIQVCNMFLLNYKTPGNMRLLAETFQRKLILEKFKVWIRINYRSFML